MIFERFEVKGLAHYSYLVGCPDSKVVAIIDPKRDVDTYLEYAQNRGLKILAIFETHIHADYASGARELSERSGAPVYLSAYDKGEIYEVLFPHTELEENQSVELGTLRVTALHTPGHTPEHISFLVFDKKVSDKTPALMFSGDFLFVGSVGRPDLLGDESKISLATSLYDTIQKKLSTLPENMPIYPAHGAGSMCGAGLGSAPSTTLAAERLANPYLNKNLDRETFVRRLLDSVPPFPGYYKRMKKLNSLGPPDTTLDRHVDFMDAAAIKALINQGAWIIDLRSPSAFGLAHIPGAINIVAGPSFVVWASWMIPADAPLLIVAPDLNAYIEAQRALSRVGLDQVVGSINSDLTAWKDAGYELTSLPQMNPNELEARLNSNNPIQVLDVRSDAEWSSGHIQGAKHIMCGQIPEKIDSLQSPDTPLAVICAGGSRSSTASSFLMRMGFTSLFNVPAGMNGLPKSMKFIPEQPSK